MDIKEAIKRIEDHKRIHFRREPMAIKITEALNMSITALERTIPQKPWLIEGRMLCPNCRGNKRSLNSYCDCCGQKIDWEVINNNT